ncbi:transglycosylase family protein [Streptomyces sp. NPDC048650]|uniref:transglycosylase family protein n=1 Tax=unclassified Streptomyces TaxID=2593676 RepID=UPI003720E06D
MSSRFVKRSIEASLSVLIVLVCAYGLTAQAAAAAAPPTAPADTDWERVAACESSGRWHINTGNGYHGGLQIDSTTWRAYGGRDFAPRADLASRTQQIAVGERIAEDRGMAPWPNCGRFGLFGDNQNEARGTTARHRHPSANRHSSSQAHRTPSAAHPHKHHRIHRGTGTRAGNAFVVQRGDCLSVIARQQHVPGGTQALYDLNKNTLEQGPDHIYPGQHLRLSR